MQINPRYLKFIIKSWKFVRILLGSFLLKMLRETFMKITDVITILSIFLFLSKLQQFIYIYQWKRNFILVQLCRKNMPWNFLFFKIWSVERLLLSSFFLTCCVLAKAKTIIHFQTEILKILNFTIGVTQLLRLIESMLKS